MLELLDLIFRAYERPKEFLLCFAIPVGTLFILFFMLMSNSLGFFKFLIVIGLAIFTAYKVNKSSVK